VSKQARQWYLRQKIADGHMKNVLSQLAYMHEADRDLFPSQKHIAAAAGISPRTAWAALKLLEHFGVIKRVARVAKHNGRISDLLDLCLESNFTLNRAVIGDARVALGLSPTVPKRWFRTVRPPRKDCEAPSQPLRTNRRVVEDPIQEGASQGSNISTAGGVPERPALGWTPKVINGGRS